MKVKKGMASSRSLLRMPNILSGRLAMNSAGNQPISMAKKPLKRPSAAREKATGKPMSITSTRPANMMGAKFSICIFYS